jgi:hypothetical protein
MAEAKNQQKVSNIGRACKVELFWARRVFSSPSAARDS